MVCDEALEARAAAYCTLMMVERSVLIIAEVRDVSTSRDIGLVIGVAI